VLFALWCVIDIASGLIYPWRLLQLKSLRIHAFLILKEGAIVLPLQQTIKPRIAITMGDPCGVGPEIIAKAYSSPDLVPCCLPVVIGEVEALERAVALLGADLTIRLLDDLTDLDRLSQRGVICVVNPKPLTLKDIAYGQPSQAACLAVIQYVEEAARLALADQIDAICTCPIHKANLQQHGFSFPGHTEFLQELTQAKNVVMMLAGPRLRVSLVTIHQALADVPRALNEALIYRTIAVTAESLRRDFGLDSVRLGVAGLNPHAGEQGRFGREELELIQPTIRRFEEGPYQVAGPFSPDTVFHRAYQGEFDAVIAMYHDQGLIPIKLVHFHDAVNVTLGLPIIRTSVNHGTAYDLAGTGKAHPGSLNAALRLAVEMARNRQRSSSPSQPELEA
jgi:4-hydroxythreonine-4-phosphate dehydrogenase